MAISDPHLLYLCHIHMFEKTYILLTQICTAIMWKSIQNVGASAENKCDPVQPVSSLGLESNFQKIWVNLECSCITPMWQFSELS